MENLQEWGCALCDSAIDTGSFKKIEDVMKDILRVILLKLNFDDSSKQVMCEICSLKVMEAFEFKSMCLYTDDAIFPYIKNKARCSVDLKKVYAKEKGIDQPRDLLDERKVCRLCMHLIESEFIAVRDINVEMIESYIPEINLSVVKNPVICKQCFESFDIHSSFIRKHLKAEKKIKSSLISCIKAEEIEIKSEANDQEVEVCQIDHSGFTTVVKPENKNVPIKMDFIEIAKGDESNASDHESVPEVEKSICKSKGIHQNIRRKSNHTSKYKKIKSKYRTKEIKTVYECKTCDFKTIWKKNLKEHQLRHEDPSKIIMYKCDICNYETKRQRTLLIHQLHHKSPSEIDMFKCIYCKFETKFKQCLRSHFIYCHRENLLDPKENSRITQMLNLKNPLPVKMYKCDRCLYKTVNKINFLNHQDKLHQKTFKCEECSYTTMSNFCFTTHQLIHKDPSEVKTYKCHNCSYKTKYKRHIVRHQLIHQNTKQVQTMHKCIYCNYESKHKEAVKSHIQVHHRDIIHDPKENLRVKRMLNLKKPLSLDVYKCDKCTYETIYKSNFTDHQLTHKDRSEVQLYKCGVCDWETKHKRRLTNHKLMHKRSCQEQIFKCGTCNFEAKQRSILNRHKLKHKNPTEIQIYKCHTCNYETNQKTCMVSHQLCHKSPSQVPMHKCDKCNFETKYINSLAKHKLMHKSPSKVRMHKCDICGYASKQKCNLNRHQLIHEKVSRV